jgi:hypothetical protein
VFGLKLARGYSPRGVVLCHVWPSEKPNGPRPGGPIQPRKRPATRRRRGGALTGDAMAAGRWQGVAGEHQWGPGVALNKMAEGGAHSRGGSLVGCDGGGSAVTSEAVEALR